VTVTDLSTPGGRRVPQLLRSTAHSVSYTYDARHPTGMTDATGTSSYTYDPFGELTSVTNAPSRPSATPTTPTASRPGPPTRLPPRPPGPAPTPSARLRQRRPADIGRDSPAPDRDHAQRDGLRRRRRWLDRGHGQLHYDAPMPVGDRTEKASSTLQSFSYSGAPDGGILSETDVPPRPTRLPPTL